VTTTKQEVLGGNEKDACQRQNLRCGGEVYFNAQKLLSRQGISTPSRLRKSKETRSGVRKKWGPRHKAQVLLGQTREGERVRSSHRPE